MISIPLPSLKPALASCFFFLTLAGYSSAVILDDSFADNERVTQNLPNSAAWRVLMGGTYSVSASTGRLTTTPSGASTFNPVSTAYFTPSGTLSLAVGESIALSFDARFSGVSATAGLNAFRFGLYNSGGSRQTGDLGSGSGDALFNGYTGYSVFGGVGAFDTGETVGFYERAASGSGATVPVSAANNTLLGSNPYVGNAVLANTTTTFSMSLSRTASGLDYTVNYAGVTLSGSDLSPVTTQFDTISVFWLTSAGGAGSIASFDNFNLAVVPEPSSALLVTAATMLVAFRRRRSG